MSMELLQHNDLSLALTQSMRQSLEVLQMDLPELRSYISEAALANPLLELQEAQQEQELVPPSRREENEDGWNETEPPAQQELSCTVTLSEPGAWSVSNSEAGGSPFDCAIEQGESFSDQLHEQLAVLPRLEPRMRALCDYLVDCLNEKGYLDFDLGELAAECGETLFAAEQALYIVQSLDPAGTGARSLSECLVLQLSRGGSFNAFTLHTATQGLQLLAENDLDGLAELLACTRAQARAAADAVRALNPIPSSGYGRSGHTAYQIPEARLECRNGTMTLEMNRTFLPRLRISRETEKLLQDSGMPEDLRYLKENETKAKQLIQCVEKRGSTIERLLQAIVHRQEGYFCRREPLQPMTMGELAKELGLNISTVSRALNGKSILFDGQDLPLKKLFSSTITSAQGVTVTSSSVKRYLALFVKAEDPGKPLSDDELRLALEAVHLPVSRRTIAKYREELGIGSSSARKRK
jgi:RNA polymerase sigma-54 factor